MSSLISALIASFSSAFRTRAALQLEIVALRHQIGVLQRSSRHGPADASRPNAVGMAVANLGRVADSQSHDFELHCRDPLQRTNRACSSRASLSKWNLRLDVP